MATVFTQTVTLAVGTRTFGPFSVPDNLTTITIRISNWPQTGRFLAFEFDLSTDGGVTFPMFVAMNPTPGGRPVGKDGTTDASVVVGPMPAVTGRLAQLITTVTGGSITTTVTVTAV